MNQKPNCRRCKCERFCLETLRLENTDNETEEVIACAKCGAIIGARDPFGRELVMKILDKLGIINSF